jgi:PAS domain S-box-containing protein
MATAQGTSGWLAQEHSPDLDHGLFRAHFDGLPGPAHIWRRRADGDFTLIAYNRAAGLLADGNVQQMLGVTASALFRNRPDIKESLLRCADRSEVVVQETDVRCASGVTRRVLITRLPLSATVVVVHMEDVTERRAAEATIAASERRFRALFQSHPDLVFRMDVVGTYLDVHVPEGVALPLPPADLLGRNIADVFGPEAAAQHWHYAREAIRTEEAQTLEYDVQVAGSARHVESRMIKSGDNEVVVNIRDITELAELEQALTQARERERSCLGGALQTQLAQLHGCVEKLKAALQSTQSLEPDVAVDHALAQVEAIVRGADEMARDLVPVAEGMPIVAALTDLAARTEQLRRVRCRLARGDEVPPMIAQTPDLYRIAQEAITNAVEHGEATEIEIICGVVNRHFVLNVVDNGKGFRLSAADNAGAGMRIMWYRAKRLGGQLTRSRRSGGGTMVTCSCPIGGAVHTDQPSKT